MEPASPARLYATVAGVVLTIAGIAGFFYSASFGSPGEVDEMLGIFAVNGWDNVLNLATGLLALVAAGYAARRCALALGVFFTVVSVWGLIVGDGGSIAGVLPVNRRRQRRAPAARSDRTRRRRDNPPAQARDEVPVRASTACRHVTGPNPPPPDAGADGKCPSRRRGQGVQGGSGGGGGVIPSAAPA